MFRSDYHWGGRPFNYPPMNDFYGVPKVLLLRLAGGRYQLVTQVSYGLGRGPSNDVTVTIFTNGGGFAHFFELYSDIFALRPGGASILFTFNEDGSVGSPFLILSTVLSISLSRSTVRRNTHCPFLSLYTLSGHMRVGGSAMLRFDGTRPNIGFMLSSRTRFHIRPVIAFVTIGVVEFFNIARRASLLSI